MPRGIKAATEIAQLTNELGQASVEAMMNRELNAFVKSSGIDSDEQQAARKMGFGSTATRASKEAEMMITIYHAYDGRVLPVEKYKVPKLCTQLFEETDEVPVEFWGKPVWSFDAGFPQPRGDVDYIYQCRLSPKSEYASEMKAAGLALVCRKRMANGGFGTQFEADEHFRKKHARRWAAYQRFVGKNATDQGTNAIVAAVQAMQALATSHSNKD